MVDLIRQLDSLGNACRSAINDMSTYSVAEVGLDRSEAAMDTFPYAYIIDYTGTDESSAGSFIMAFRSMEEARDLSFAIARKMLGSRPDDSIEETHELLNEFLNVLVGRAVSEWDRIGLMINIGTPSFRKNFRLDAKRQRDHVLRIIVNDPASDGGALEQAGSQTVIHMHFIEQKTMILEGKKILIVDDSKVMRAVVRKALEKQGCTVFEAGSGEEAVKVYKTQFPDLTIMDINLPGINGFQTIDRIRNTSPRSKFIILSSISRKDEILKAKVLKVTGYMVKPPDMKELISRILEAISD